MLALRSAEPDSRESREGRADESFHLDFDSIPSIQVAVFGVTTCIKSRSGVLKDDRNDLAILLATPTND